MSNLHIMCGLPASGKSTYISKWAFMDDRIVHRDEVRAALRERFHTDQYFPCPADEEYGYFLDACRYAANRGVDLWIDQTTLSVGSVEGLECASAALYHLQHDYLRADVYAARRLP